MKKLKEPLKRPQNKIFLILFHFLFFIFKTIKSYFFTGNLLDGVNLKRNPIEQFLKDPDNKARVFVWMTYGMVITTFLITIGFLFFILHLVGIF